MKLFETATFIGVLPNGQVIHASVGLVAQLGINRVRYELVDSVWLAETGSAPGYYPVRTGLDGPVVLIKAASQEEAIVKYFNESN